MHTAAVIYKRTGGTVCIADELYKAPVVLSEEILRSGLFEGDTMEIVARRSFCVLLGD